MVPDHLTKYQQTADNPAEIEFPVLQHCIPSQGALWPTEASIGGSPNGTASALVIERQGARGPQRCHQGK